MGQDTDRLTELNTIRTEIKKISDTFVFSGRDIALHFQTLISASASRMLMEAPGLYYPEMDLYVISRSGMNRGHRSFVRSCLDKLLRKTTKNITPQLRISMENVFNRRFHRKMKLVDSAVEKEIIKKLKNDLGKG
jgi:hypothetical protein